jgi:hypothetical protein
MTKTTIVGLPMIGEQFNTGNTDIGQRFQLAFQKISTQQRNFVLTAATAAATR